MKLNTRDRSLQIINYALLVLFFVFVLIPFVTIILTSVKTDQEVVEMPSRTLFHRIFPDNWLNFSNFVNVWIGNTIIQSGAPFFRAIINSIIVLVITIIPSLILSLCAAYSFCKFKYPGKEIFYYLFLGLLMIPTEMISMPLYQIVASAGFVNTYFGLMIPQFLSAFGIFLFRSGMEQIPNSYIEAGRIDGAGELWIFVRIITPMSQAFIITFLVIKSVWSWNDFFWPMLTTTSESMRTITVMLARFFGDTIKLWAPIMAAVVISIIPLLIMFICFSSQIKTGLMNSGIKG
jgi:ABC-type glycerol-3-phosphate transport system permease component